MRIALTKGRVTIVDQQDAAAVLARGRWYCQIERSGKAYAKRREYVRGSYAEGKPRHLTVYLHRFLLDPGKGFEVDHINGDGLDNRRPNLRIVTQAQNRQNQRLRRDNRSGLRGVYFENGRRKWCARVSVGHLRRFRRFATKALAQTAATAWRAELLPFSREARR